MKKQVRKNLDAVKTNFEAISTKELKSLKGGTSDSIVTEDLIDV